MNSSKKTRRREAVGGYAPAYMDHFRPPKSDNLYAEAELPGVKVGDVDIAVMGNELSIKGKRSEQIAGEAAPHRRERGVGEFSRVVRLPVEVAAEGVQATLHDGVLFVTLPKAPSAKPRKIEVSAGR